MTAERDRGRWVPRATGQPMAGRVLAVAVGLAAAVHMCAAPAHADMVGDSFLTALNNAGVTYNDPEGTVALGQSICPMLVAPGGTFTNAASSVVDHNGMSPEMAGLFTVLAIATYCPAMISLRLPDRLQA